MLPNGYVPPSKKPVRPVQWTLLDGGGRRTTGGDTEDRFLWEFDPTGYDDFGYEVSVNGMGTSDTATFRFKSPEGGVIATASVYYSTGATEVYISTSTNPNCIMWPRISVWCQMSNWSGTPNEIDCLVNVMLRRTGT